MESRLLEYKESGQRKSTKFEPSAEQLVFARFYIECKGNITAASILYGNPSRSIYYIWVEQSGFQEWLQEYAKTEVLKHRGRWYLLLEKFAEKGSFHHLDRLLEIAREFTKPNGINININTEGNTTVETPHAVIFTAVKNDLVKSECPKP